MQLTSLRWATPVLLLAAACGVYRLAVAGNQEPPIQVAKPQPNLVAPRYDEPLVATDEQLHGLLARMRPPAGKPDTNIWVHALRMWGPQAEFNDPAHPDGATMLAYYLDDREFRRLAGDAAPPLFEIDEYGVRVRPWFAANDHQRTGAVHVDDLLATLAESGVPLDTPLHTREGETTVGALLDRAMLHFHRDQHEYEWSLISYARYLFPTLEWTTKYGERMTVDEAVDELIEQDPHNGICGGTHRLEALVVLNRVDEQYNVLPRRTKQKLLAHLHDMSRRLVASQYPDGQWGKNWPRGAAALAEDPGIIDDQILATGHHLEWLALAPPEVQPPRETIVRAGQWIARTMLELDQADIERRYGPFSHAARALCLWRNMEPYEAWQQLNQQPAGEAN